MPIKIVNGKPKWVSKEAIAKEQKQRMANYKEKMPYKKLEEKMIAEGQHEWWGKLEEGDLPEYTSTAKKSTTPITQEQRERQKEIHHPMEVGRKQWNRLKKLKKNGSIDPQDATPDIVTSNAGDPFNAESDTTAFINQEGSDITVTPTTTTPPTEILQFTSPTQATPEVDTFDFGDLGDLSPIALLLPFILGGI